MSGGPKAHRSEGLEPSDRQPDDRPSGGRQTSVPAFWDARYAGPDLAFGAGPNAFVAEQAGRFAPGARVLDLGAGEGRNAVFLARRGCRVTALDFAPVGLRRAESWAAAEGLALQTAEADLATWWPEAAWDGVVCTFVHLLPDERAHLWRAVQAALRPGGVLVGEWFAPGNPDVGGPGPSAEDRLVSVGEVRRHLTGGALDVCREVRRTLDEGPYLAGPASTVQVVFRRD